MYDEACWPIRPIVRRHDNVHECCAVSGAHTPASAPRPGVSADDQLRSSLSSQAELLGPHLAPWSCKVGHRPYTRVLRVGRWPTCQALGLLWGRGGARGAPTTTFTVHGRGFWIFLFGNGVCLCLLRDVAFCLQKKWPIQSFQCVSYSYKHITALKTHTRRWVEKG